MTNEDARELAQDIQDDAKALVGIMSVTNRAARDGLAYGSSRKGSVRARWRRASTLTWILRVGGGARSKKSVHPAAQQSHTDLFFRRFPM